MILNLLIGQLVEAYLCEWIVQFSRISLPFLEYSISAAAIAIFSVAFMILGTICAIAALAQGQDYIYKPAGMFYAFAGKPYCHIPITKISLLSLSNRQ